jgi:hypothetical protein
MLCGLLGFVARGTLTQAALGLVITECVLLAFMRCVPKRSHALVWPALLAWRAGGDA